jgi:hypothetical protein
MTDTETERYVLVANYCVQEFFKLPRGLDLNDKTKVSKYCVKWNTLYVLLVDGTELKIESGGYLDDFDYKFPDDTEQQPIGETCLDDSDDDE